MRRWPLLSVAAAAAIAVAAPAHAGSLDDCAPGATCADALPVNSVWQDAVGLPSVPHRDRGDGVTVALLDTGVTQTTDLDASDGTTRLVARVDLTSDHDGLDHFGHGTHMAGLVAGTADGAAPEASLVSVKVAGWDGATDVSTVIAGLQWIVSHRARYGIRVISLSYGTDAVQPAQVDPLDEAVERAWKAGILVVVSAGNSGGAVTKPGDDPYVLTVGAADVNGTATTADDAVAPFSSRGGGKPDLLAPGVALVSERAPGSTLDVLHPLARVGDTSFKGTGTSQAAAVVAGIAARVLDAEPTLTPDQVKALLVGTADPTLAGTPGAGAGLVNAAAAVDAAELIRSGKAAPPATPAPPPASDGSGSLEGSRGTLHVVADPTGSGVPSVVQGELDVLGLPWDAAVSATRWTPTGWDASPWAERTATIDGWSAPPAWTGPSTSLTAWSALYWGALYWGAAGWAASAWDASYWGANYWGGARWQ